jgi:hypothetical protein
MNYSLPYILLLLFILGISLIQIGLHLTDKSRKRINYFVMGAYVLFFGFRGFIGWDWTNYYPYFQSITPNNLFSFEPGFVFYTLLIKSIFKDYQIFILISTLINFILLNIFFKRYLNEKYYALGFALFIAFSGFVLEVDLMRNIKSLLLFMISLKYIEEKSIIKFLLFNIIALLFHWSSILFLPLYFIFQKPIPLRFFLIIFVVGNTIILLNLHYIKPVLLFIANILGGTTEIKISAYVGNELFSKPYGLSYGYFVRFFTSLLIMFYYEKLLKYSKSTVIFVNAYFILMVIFLFFSELSIAISRLNILFDFSLCILIPVLLDIIKPISTKLALYLLYGALIIAKIASSSNNILYNYDNTLLGKTQSYKERLKIFDSNHKKLFQ